MPLLTLSLEDIGFRGPAQKAQHKTPSSNPERSESERSGKPALGKRSAPKRICFSADPGIHLRQPQPGTLDFSAHAPSIYLPALRPLYDRAAVFPNWDNRTAEMVGNPHIHLDIALSRRKMVVLPRGQAVLRSPGPEQDHGAGRTSPGSGHFPKRKIQIRNFR